MKLSVSDKQMKSLLKGKPVQLKYKDLTSATPNIKIGMLGGALTKKIQRAMKEQRGCRCQLSPEEIESVEGGAMNIKKGLKKVGKDIQRGFKKNIVDTGVGKQIAKSLIDVGTDVVLPAALAGLSTYATGDPMLGKVAGDVAGSQLNKLAAKYGYGLKGKPLKAIKDKMTTLLKPIAETDKKAKALTTKIFKEGEKVLDLPEISITGGKISFKTVTKGLKSAAKQLWREAKPVLKHYGEEAISMAAPMIEEGLASVAESYGVDPVSAKIGAKSLTSYGSAKAKRALDKNLTKQKSQTPQMALDKVSNIVQDRGDKLIQDVKLKGLESIQKYVPAEQRDTATQMLLSQTQKAEDDLRSGVEQTESALLGRVSGKQKGVRGMGRKIGKAVLSSGRKVPLIEGGALAPQRDDMGTLLSHTHPATMPMKPKAELPQGQISGGSFRGYSGRGTLQYDEMLGGSFR